MQNFFLTAKLSQCTLLFILNSHSQQRNFLKIKGQMMQQLNNFFNYKYTIIIHSKQSNRNDVVLATKVRFNTKDKEPNNLGLSRRHIIQALEGSLQRLQTEYIDLYQVVDILTFQLDCA
jgi:predicted aldo/keto reductase-like oxidoreductase